MNTIKIFVSKSILIIVLIICSTVYCKGQNNIQIRGWNILPDSESDANLTIDAARLYNINHLQLSHNLVMDLHDMREKSKRDLVNRLISRAHEAGIEEVIAWDHALYDLNYYPDKFKTGPFGTLNFDDKEFWDWFKTDYREMMGLIPDIDGLVLTFIETGARSEDQYSINLKTAEEKLAAVVDAIASVIVNELGKKLYIRTFAYTHQEYAMTIGCISHIKNNNIIIMMKETPHDFFLTHPNDGYAGMINRPTIIEFDCGNEYNGQGVIANTWPELIIRRWSDFVKRANIVGYVARTDRYGDTRIVGTPNEILLYALKKSTDDQSLSVDDIYRSFISENYGEKFPKGQWNWIEDASRAKEYYKKITQTGWKEYGDVVFEN